VVETDGKPVVEKPKKEVENEVQKPTLQRPPSASVSRRRMQQQQIEQEAESDEVEIDDDEIEIENNNDRPVTSRGTRGQTENLQRPVTRNGRNNERFDPFLVQTTMADDNETNKIGTENIMDNDDKQHGALVENMLKVRESANNNNNDSGIVENFELNSQQKKEVERRRQELIKTQETIQELSRAILPLAKAADYAQEDSDQMAKEHQQWRTQVAQSKQHLSHIYHRNVVKSNDKYRAKVLQLEQEVENKKAQIRAQYYQNTTLEERLNKLTQAILGKH